MGLAAVVIEKHARRTVQLGYDYPLGTVNNKGTRISHQGHFAHVDFLFTDIFYCRILGFLVINNQTYFDPQWRCIGHATHRTFFGIKGRGTQAEADKFQRRIA